jgi:hypothetical protein
MNWFCEQNSEDTSGLMFRSRRKQCVNAADLRVR